MRSVAFAQPANPGSDGEGPMVHRSHRNDEQPHMATAPANGKDGAFWRPRVDRWPFAECLAGARVAKLLSLA